MDQPRSMADLMREAHRRASRHAPPPTWRPLTGGLVGAAVFAVPMILIVNELSLYALILNAVVGFAVWFYFLKRRQDAYHRAFENELAALKSINDPQTREAP